MFIRNNKIMKITDLVEKDDLLCDPNKDFVPYYWKS